MNRRAFLAASGIGVTSVLSGCLGRGLSDEDFDIGMSQNAFLPEEYEVSVGETVVWGNNGSRGHTVTAYDSAIPDEAEYFASGGYEDLSTAIDDWYSSKGGNIPPGETYEHTFEVRGHHPYLCIPHEPGDMVGVVIVTE